MEIQIDGDRALVRPVEQIDLSTAENIEELFRKLREEKVKDVTLDFAGVEEIDSFGLGKILLLNKETEERGGNLKIINVTSEYVREMFAIVQMDKVVEIEF